MKGSSSFVKLLRHACMLCIFILGLASIIGTSGGSSSSDTFKVLVWPDDNAGSVSIDPEGVDYAPGDVIALTAKANAGWRFDRWEGPVENPGVPVTRATVEKRTTINAIFLETSLAGRSDSEDSAVLNLDSNGALSIDVDLATPVGSTVKVPRGLHLVEAESGPLQGSPTFYVRDIPVSDIQPVSFTNWVWAFDIQVAHPDRGSGIMFSSHDASSLGDPDYFAHGVLFGVSWENYGLPPGTEVSLFLQNDEDHGEQEGPVWERIANTLIEQDGMVYYSIYREGLYAIGAWQYHEPVSIAPSQAQLYDCTVEFDGVIDRISLIENSNAALFGIWFFPDVPADQMPETTQWIVKGGNYPSMGRLENYGQRFRVRSQYANRFTVSSVSLKTDDRNDLIDRSVAMAGPYEVDANGHTAQNPVPNPYEQCDRIFATEVDMTVLSQSGDYQTFMSEIVRPLRGVYDDPLSIGSNVQVRHFRKLNQGYHAHLTVATTECTANVGYNTLILDDEHVFIGLIRGRMLSIIDLRGGGPYLAAGTFVADNTVPGIRFFSPFWDAELLIHELGGPNNMIAVIQAMQYNPVSDTLWVQHVRFEGMPDIHDLQDLEDLLERSSLSLVLSRFDNPLYNFGDRPPDFQIDLGGTNEILFEKMHLDPVSDRLYIMHVQGGEHGVRVKIYDDASTSPVLANQVVSRISKWDAGETEPLYADYMASDGDTLYLFRRYGTPVGPVPKHDGFNLYTYDLGQHDHTARFRAMASFGGERNAPILANAYSHASNILYAGTHIAFNGFSSIQAIRDFASWNSPFVPSPHGGMGHYIPDHANTRKLTWNNAGDIRDVSIIEGDMELMAILQTPPGWDLNSSQILLFENVNHADGNISPVYTRDFMTQPIRSVELINPPQPVEAGH